MSAGDEPLRDVDEAWAAQVNPAPGRYQAEAGVRDARQVRALSWARAAFGDREACSLPQRGLRLVEEAIEAAQAAGTPKDKIVDLVHHIYRQPAGALGQEIGGVALTTMILAEAASVSADVEEQRELARVLSRPLEHFAARNQAKNDLGFIVVAAECEPVQGPDEDLEAVANHLMSNGYEFRQEGSGWMWRPPFDNRWRALEARGAAIKTAATFRLSRIKGVAGTDASAAPPLPVASPVVQFLYLLVRDHLPAGAINGVLERLNAGGSVLSDKALAAWAESAAISLERGE